MKEVIETISIPCAELLDRRDENINSLLSQLDQANTTIDKLKADAARYQYIRDNQYWQRFDDFSVIGVKFPYETDFQCKPMLDHAIDEALLKEVRGE